MMEGEEEDKEERGRRGRTSIQNGQKRWTGVLIHTWEVSEKILNWVLLPRVSQDAAEKKAGEVGASAPLKTWAAQLKHGRRGTPRLIGNGTLKGELGWSGRNARSPEKTLWYPEWRERWGERKRRAASTPEPLIWVWSPRQRSWVNWQPGETTWWQKHKPGDRRPGLWPFALICYLCGNGLRPNGHDFKTCKLRVIICLLNGSIVKPNQKIKMTWNCYIFIL